MMALMGARADEGFERFCREAHPRLVAALGHHLGDQLLAEEFAHEALVRVGERWAVVGQMDAPLGWAFRVGVNFANSHFRRRRAEQRAMQRHGPLHTAVVEQDGVVDRLAVHDALCELPSKQRQAVVLRFYLGLSTEQTAHVLGLTNGAVRSLTHRAVEKLRARLDLTDLDGETIDAT